MAYRTSTDYRRMIELLKAGETVIYRKTPTNYWNQITAAKPIKQGRKITIYGMSEENWLNACRAWKTEFIDPEDTQK